MVLVSGVEFSDSALVCNSVRYNKRLLNVCHLVTPSRGRDVFKGDFCRYKVMHSCLLAIEKNLKDHDMSNVDTQASLAALCHCPRYPEAGDSAVPLPCPRRPINHTGVGVPGLSPCTCLLYSALQTPFLPCQPLPRSLCPSGYQQKPGKGEGGRGSHCPLYFLRRMVLPLPEMGPQPGGSSRTSRSRDTGTVSHSWKPPRST